MTLKVRVNDALLKRELQRLAKRASAKNLETALVSGAVLISNAAKRLAPLLTGVLRRSIHVGGHTNKSGGFRGGEGGQYSDIGGNDFSNGKAEVLIGTNLVYAAIHEFGGRILATPKMRAYLHYIGIHLRAATTHITIKAQPYLRPAFSQEWRKALRKTRDVLKQLLIDK